MPARAASQASAGDGGRRRPSHRDNDFLYGIYPVLMALRAGKRRCKRLWTQKARGPQTVAPKDEEARAEILERAEALGITLSETSRASLDRMSEDRPHQGFILKAGVLLPPELEALPPAQPGALWVALEGVTDPMNLGSVLRSAAFFGASGVVCEKGLVRMTAVASKASAGAGERLPLFGAEKLRELLDRARGDGWCVAGTALQDPDDDTVRASTLQAWLQECASGRGPKGVVLVLGPEGPGLRQELRHACDILIRVEGGDSGLDSLNVGVAAGITIHGVRNALDAAGASPAGAAAAAPSAPAGRAYFSNPE